MSTVKKPISPFLEGVGKLIRSARGEHSQSEFASMIGVSRSALSAYENGTRRADEYVLSKIASASNVSLEELQRGYSHDLVRRVKSEHPRFRIGQIDDAFVHIFNMFSIDRKREALFILTRLLEDEDIKDEDKIALQIIIDGAHQVIDDYLERRAIAREFLERENGGSQDSSH